MTQSVSKSSIQIIDIKKSSRKNKKYVANVVIDGITHQNIHFGDIRYNHFRDSTPIKLYSHLDHNDHQRRLRFHQRHKSNTGPSSTMSKFYLW